MEGFENSTSLSLSPCHSRVVLNAKHLKFASGLVPSKCQCPWMCSNLASHSNLAMNFQTFVAVQVVSLTAVICWRRTERHSFSCHHIWVKLERCLKISTAFRKSHKGDNCFDFGFCSFWLSLDQILPNPLHLHHTCWNVAFQILQNHSDAWGAFLPFSRGFRSLLDTNILNRLVHEPPCFSGVHHEQISILDHTKSISDSEETQSVIWPSLWGSQANLFDLRAATADYSSWWQVGLLLLSF